MAGDPDLELAQNEEPALVTWLHFFIHVRWGIAFSFVPGAWAVCKLTHAPFNAKGFFIGLAIGAALNATVALVFRRDRQSLARDPVRLARFISSVSLLDVLLMTAAAHFAGGAMGLFWPFPFIPVVLCAALLRSMRSLFTNGVFAIVAMVLSAMPSTPGEVIAPALLSTLLVGCCAMIVIALSRSVKQQHRVADELERARIERRLAEALAKRREEILSVVSHELASPLMTLRGYVKLMQESKNRERNAQLLERVERQVTRITSLADDLLEMASTKAGAVRLRRRPFDLVEALHELRDDVLVHQLEAEIEISGEEHVRGVWDRERLDQLFGNLVSNAVKFAGARSRVTLDVLREGARHVHVRVLDDGPGISRDALPRVFEPFQRYSSERGGLGLGLAIARSVTELHEGHIWAESPNDASGRGATIHVVLPTDMAPSTEAVGESVDDAGEQAVP